MRPLSVIFLSSLYAFLNVSGAALIKSELTKHALTGFQSYVNLLFTVRVIVGFVIIFASALVIFKVLSLGKFSYVIPLATGINFLLTVFAGYFFFGDRLTWLSYAGLVLLLSGIFVMSLSQ